MLTEDALVRVRAQASLAPLFSVSYIGDRLEGDVPPYVRTYDVSFISRAGQQSASVPAAAAGCAPASDFAQSGGLGDSGGGEELGGGGLGGGMSGGVQGGRAGGGSGLIGGLDGGFEGSTAAAGSEQIPLFVLQADLGIWKQELEVRQRHRTSLRDCSCQLPKCSGLLCRHQLAVWSKLTSSGLSIANDIHSLAFHVKQTIAPVWLKDSHEKGAIDELVLSWRRKVLRLHSSRASADADTSRPVSFTATELTRYALNQIRPIAELHSTSEANINLFIAHAIEYNELNPVGVRSPAARSLPLGPIRRFFTHASTRSSLHAILVQARASAQRKPFETHATRDRCLHRSYLTTARFQPRASC